MMGVPLELPSRESQDTGRPRAVRAGLFSGLSDTRGGDEALQSHVRFKEPEPLLSWPQ